jgi:Core-2/I-Branching enzyme
VKTAYLIMAHTAPAQLRRLVELLRHPDVGIFVHIDAKADASAFSELTPLGVRFCRQQDRVRVHWGDYSQLEATMTLMRAALGAAERFDRLVLLSGMDLPLLPAAPLQQFFEEHATTEFVNLVPIPCAKANKTERRLTDRWFRPSLAGKIHRRLVRHGLLPATRDYRPAFADLKPFAGSQWWALTRACSEFVLAEVAARPRLVRFIKGTACADETLIQTLIGNSRFAAHVVRALTFTRWKPGASSPDVLEPDDMQQLLAHPEHLEDSVYGGGPILFARKFNEATSAQAVELVRASVHAAPVHDSAAPQVRRHDEHLPPHSDLAPGDDGGLAAAVV